MPTFSAPVLPSTAGLALGSPHQPWTVYSTIDFGAGGGGVVLNAEPLLIDLPDTSFAALNTWYPVVPSTVFNLPRSTKSLVMVQIGIHLIWTAGNNSQANCDWSADGQAHFFRSFHMILDRQDDSSVNDVALNFPMIVIGTNQATIGISARQVNGPLGMSVVGANNATWPALGSKAFIYDMGETA
jgi:hypothetical protein